MAVKLVPRFTKEQIQKLMTERFLKIDQALLMRLKRIGETFVKNARENGTYTDRTGNLRNSIGYVILRDGVQMFDGFKKVVAGGNEGTKNAKDLVFELSRKFPRGYVLIVVAGMEYAAAVESRGKDVLTVSSITAKNDLKKAIKELSEKIPGMK